MDVIAFWQMQLWEVNIITNFSILPAQQPAGMFQSYYYLILLPVVRFAERNSVCSPGYFHRKNLPFYRCLFLEKEVFIK
jgi:hypothetical protein